MNGHTDASTIAQLKTKLTQRLSKRRQRGVTLVELSVAVAVMGLIMAGAMVGVPRLMNNVKLSQEMKDWQMSVLAVQNAVASGTLTPNLPMADILKTAIVEPFNHPSGADYLLNRFGGKVTMKGVSGSTYPSSGVEVEAVGYPSAQCTDFVGKMNGLFATIEVNGQDLKSDKTVFDPMKVSDGCSKKGSDAATQAEIKFTIAG